MSFNDLLKRRKIEKKLDSGLASLAQPTIPKPVELITATTLEPPLESLVSDIIAEADQIASEISDSINDVVSYNSADPVFNRYHELVNSSYFDPMQLIESPDTGPLIDLPYTEIRSLERSLFHNSADPFAVALNMLYQVWFTVRSIQYVYEDLIKLSIQGNKLFTRKRDAKDARNLMLRHQQKLRRIKEAMMGLKLSSNVATPEYSGVLASVLLEKENVARFVEPSDLVKILKMLLEYLMLTNMEHWEKCQDILLNHFGGLPTQALNVQITEAQPIFVSAGIRHILPLFDKHKNNSSLAGFSNAIEQAIRMFSQDMESSLISAESDDYIETIVSSFLVLLRKEEVQQYIASVNAVKSNNSANESASQVSAATSAIDSALKELSNALNVPWKTPSTLIPRDRALEEISSNNNTQKPVKKEKNSQASDKSAERSGSEVSKNDAF